MKHTGILLILIVVVVIIQASISYNLRYGWVMSSESYMFLSHYLGPKPITQKIFDFRGNDTLPTEHGYRARDVSNVFNYLDAEMVLFGIRLGIPGLLSFVHYICLISFIIIQVYFVSKFYSRSFILFALISSLIFLSSPSAFLSGVYFRTSKIIIATLLTLVFWQVLGFVKKRIKTTTNSLTLLFVLAIFLVLTDEIGIAVVLGSLCITLLITRGNHLSHSKKLPILFFGSFIFALFYRYVIGPMFVYITIGIWPGLWGLMTENGLHPRFIQNGIIFYLELTGLILGNTGILGAIIVHLGLLGVIMWVRRGHFLWPLVFVFIVIGAMGIIGLMSSTKPIILESPLSRLRYYPLPFHVLMVLFITVTACEVIKYMPKLRQVVSGIIIVIVAANIYALPSHIKTFDTSNRDSGFSQSPDIIPAVVSKNYIENPKIYTERQIEVIKVIRYRLGKQTN